MAIGTTAALAIGIGVAVAGASSAAIAAATKVNPKYDSASVNAVTMGQQGQLGSTGTTSATNALGQMSSLTNDPSFQGNTDLATLLGQYSSTGGVPTSGDITNAQKYASSQFDPQQVAMQQAFLGQRQQANQQAAISGRGTNDPVLLAKLAQQQTQQSAELNAQKGQFSSQYANQLSQQRVQYAEGRANTLTQNYQQQLGLANNIFSAGLQAQNQDFSQRLQQYQTDLGKAETVASGGYQQQKDTTSAGQAASQAINGGIASLGSGLSTFGTLSGAGTKNPFSTPSTGGGTTSPNNSAYYANLYGAK